MQTNRDYQNLIIGCPTNLQIRQLASYNSPKPWRKMKVNFQDLTSLCFDCGSKINYVPPNQFNNIFHQILLLSKQKKVTNMVIHNESIIVHSSTNNIYQNSNDLIHNHHIDSYKTFIMVAFVSHPRINQN